MAFVLKVECLGQTHRMPLAASPGEKPKLDTVLNAIDAITPRPKTCVAKYTNVDGDLCTLIETTFADFLAIALEMSSNSKGPAVLKLKVLPTADELLGPAMAPVARHLRLGRRGGLCSACGMNSVQTRSHWEEDSRDLDELVAELGEGLLPDNVLPHRVIPSTKRAALKARKQKKLKRNRGVFPSDGTAPNTLNAVAAKTENQLDEWPKQGDQDEDHARCDSAEQRKQGDQNEQHKHDTLVEKQHEQHNQVEHHKQGDENAGDRQDALAVKQHEQHNQVEHHEHGDQNDEDMQDALAENTPYADLQLWPSTPENTPPSTPCHLQPLQQLVWVPVLVQFASNSSNVMEGVTPPVPE